MSETSALMSVLILCVVLLIGLVHSRLAGIEKRIAKLSRVDAKLDVLLKHAGIEYDPYKNLPHDVVDALRRGKKIEAIKKYREATGADLKEAKDFIEVVQRAGNA
jgi:hypothetical protein